MSAAPKTPNLVRQWVEKAEHDLLNVENNLAASRIPWDTVCFHEQQCAEKYLKALLTLKEIDFPKSHDLTELVVRVPSDVRLGVDAAVFEGLNPYSIEGRYPGVWEPIEREEALNAVAAARKIRQAIRALLPREAVQL